MGWTDLNKKIESLGAKRRISYNWHYDGRKGAIAIITLEDKVYRGTSNCSDKDVFDKQLGRLIALGRAYHTMMGKLNGK